MARISPTRGQKLIFILYILLGVGILYLDITSNSFQSVKNGFKSFKISSSYFLNQITIEQIKNLSKRSKSKKSLIKENEMLKEALDLSHLNNYLIAKENNFYKDHEIIKYAAHGKNYQSSYKIAQLRSFDPNTFNCCDRHRMFVEVISNNNEDFNEFMVFNSSGIIGQIIHTNKYSEVLLLTDISHYIPIKSNILNFTLKRKPPSSFLILEDGIRTTTRAPDMSKNQPPVLLWLSLDLSRNIGSFSVSSFDEEK